MNSIKRFLIIVLLSVITLSTFIASLQGYHSSFKEVGRLFDEQLIDIAKLIANFPHQQTEQHVALSDNLAFQIFQQQQLVQHSSNTPTSAIVDLSPGFSYTSFNGYRWRSYVQKINKHKYIIVAERVDLQYSLAEEIIVKAVYPAVISIPIIGLLIWLIITRGLKPLSDLAAKLRLKKTQDLSPLENTFLPKELQTIVSSINDLFKRLGDAFEREKRFSSDAAHELKTPLSALKIHLYNIEKSLPAGNEDIKLLEQSIDRMIHVIEQILDLYRTSPEQIRPSFTTINPYYLAQEAIKDLYPAIDKKQQEIALVGSDCQMTGNDFALSILLKNIIDNAYKYTPEHGRIRLTIQASGANIIIVIEDSGPGIDEAFHVRAFERFYRIHGDQHNSSVIGCGLGLSIVKHIVSIHQGSIALSHSHWAGGLKITIQLPINSEQDHV